eukprot:g3992.t1
MASSASLHYQRYDSAQQAIKAASTLGGQKQAERVDAEAGEGASLNGGQPPTPTTQLNGRSGGASQQQDEHNPEQRPVAVHRIANACVGGEQSDDAVEGGREDECLGVLTEAFADDLDLLRQESTFTGSSKNIAAMADMMRCLASGMDSTEQTMLLENATR